MAADVRAIVANLAEFYDFGSKVVVDVGAGGGQLVEFARPARRVVAVDRIDERSIASPSVSRRPVFGRGPNSSAATFSPSVRRATSCSSSSAFIRCPIRSA